MIGKKVHPNMGITNQPTKTAFTIVEQIGFGYLGRNECNRWCAMSYDFCGKLHTYEITTEDEARKQAEADSGKMA